MVSCSTDMWLYPSYKVNAHYTRFVEKKYCTMTEREKMVNKLEREKFQPPYNKSVSMC